jgi:molecular chaperone GrpE (heat shock protein)
MTTEIWWVLVVVALLLGAAAGSWFTFRFARRRFASRLRRATEELQQRHAASAEKLRAAQLRAQTELEQTRNSFKRQLAVVAAEPRAAAARAEERLRAVYDELDRLRRGGGAPDTGSADLAEGFAATRPMREGL